MRNEAIVKLIDLADLTVTRVIDNDVRLLRGYASRGNESVRLSRARGVYDRRLVRRILLSPGKSSDTVAERA